jgi:hypothetical protein
MLTSRSDEIEKPEAALSSSDPGPEACYLQRIAGDAMRISRHRLTCTACD